ncbi:MAG: protoporphyrinogen oxidase HemJ [Pseudomonadota bacterium]
MVEFLGSYYLWIQALHIIAVMSWMAGMLYLPRLFVYHAQSKERSEQSETFKVMERRLLKFIINPAMLLTFIFGGLMLWVNPALFSEPWMHAKLAAIFLLAGVHGMFSKWQRNFEFDLNTKSAKFYKIWNEVPTVLMIIIVIMAVAKPF